ncbi:MAG TPA: Bax inhibitor-1/YccA family protein [Bacteroidia bacterium]|nr:Bax inhibitor-1/YccA family protein [Bacteroidia bacterium]
METNNFNYVQSQGESASMSKTFVASVFSWMSAALVITAIVAYYFANDLQLLSLLVNFETGKMNGLGYVAVFAPLGISFLLPVAFKRFSYVAILLLFLTFAILMGVSLSFIFLMYTASSIYTVFLSCAGMFGLMAVVGYTTKTDLTKFGSIMMMAVLGLVISSVINFFVASDTFSYIIGFIGVIVFTGLTAYQVQALKELGATESTESETGKKYVIHGAFSLYITFINLFLSLLRIFGDRK